MGPRRARPHEFQDLMRFRIMDVILVSTPYDKFVLEEAGELSERLFGEFRNMDLHYPPGLTGVTSGREALALARDGQGTKLIITTPRVRDMDALTLAERARAEAPGVPIVVLAWNSSELAHWTRPLVDSGIESAYLWQGDAQILVAIVKAVEDRRNVEHDVRECGVQVILVVEDVVRHWSSFLPRMYQVLLETSQRVVREGLNQSQKILRMRARPKILLCRNYEEAERTFEAYHEDVMGIVTDVEFPRAGVDQPTAGADFVRMVQARHPDIPILMHSSRGEYAALARELGVGFLPKGSPLMLDHLEHVMLEVFGFGDFTFRLPDGQEVARASNLGELQRAIATIPVESLLFHGRGNHFSRWLKARTEFSLAKTLRPLTVGDFRDPEALRRGLLQAIAEYRWERGQLVVAEFDGAGFDFGSDFYRLGGGSIGGKARGVAFVRRLLGERRLRARFPGVTLGIPGTVVIGTQVFDEFLETNGLLSFALECQDDVELESRFEQGRLSEALERDLAAFLAQAPWPLAVRSSSLLEDSQHRPFTGVYETLMLRNALGDAARRLADLVRAVKRVFASTFSRRAKRYIAATSYRLEEEKMAVMLQRVVGARHGPRFYPDFSGVVRSHNFYPVGPMSARDGVAAVALGLGRAVMSEGASLRFSPRHPQSLLELSTVEDVLANTQRTFWALPMGVEEQHDMREMPYGLGEAETDGTLAALASTWSAENDAIHDGTSRRGQRLVTFAPILKLGLFPLAEILEALMEAGEEGMGLPVEIEFAVNLARPGGTHEFSVLQMRPMTLMSESESVDVGPLEPERVLVRSGRVLGNGRIEDLRDLVVVDFQRFERARSREAADEIGRLNAELQARGTPYVLIGVGRWGSRDPWLGIPVTWDQVSGARVIVEAGLRDLRVTPSQGSHFFQNLTAFQVGYFTVNPGLDEGEVDWSWLDARPAMSEHAHVRHVRLDAPMLVIMNGRRGEGVIAKPLEGPA